MGSQYLRIAKSVILSNLVVIFRVIFVILRAKPTIMTELHDVCERKRFVKNNNENKNMNNLRFCHFPFWYFADVYDTK